MAEHDDLGALPVFKPTSSPELDTLLTTIRHKYFLPQYLNEAQRKLIRSTKMRSQLENDPVMATLGEEEIRLEHLDVTKDMPPKRAFLDAIKMISESGDKKAWQNLPGLLEGYYRSHVRLDPAWLSQTIERARIDGALSTVVQCLQQVEQNGFSLSIPAVREGILLAIRQTAREAAWTHIDTVKALKRAEGVIGQMEHPEHCGSRKVTEQDPRAEPYVVAVPLELAARDVLVNGKDHTTKIEVYSTRLITALAQQKSALVCAINVRSRIHFAEANWISQTETASWQIPGGLTPLKTTQAFQTLDRNIAKFIPVHGALKLAQQVRGTMWPEDERAFAAHLQKQIEQKLNSAVSEAGKRADMGITVEMPAVEEWETTRDL